MHAQGLGEHRPGAYSASSRSSSPRCTRASSRATSWCAPPLVPYPITTRPAGAPASTTSPGADDFGFHVSGAHASFIDPAGRHSPNRVTARDFLAGRQGRAPIGESELRDGTSWTRTSARTAWRRPFDQFRHTDGRSSHGGGLGGNDE